MLICYGCSNPPLQLPPPRLSASRRPPTKVLISAATSLPRTTSAMSQLEDAGMAEYHWHELHIRASICCRCVQPSTSAPPSVCNMQSADLLCVQQPAAPATSPRLSASRRPPTKVLISAATSLPRTTSAMSQLEDAGMAEYHWHELHIRASICCRCVQPSTSAPPSVCNMQSADLLCVQQPASAATSPRLSASRRPPTRVVISAATSLLRMTSAMSQLEDAGMAEHHWNELHISASLC